MREHVLVMTATFLLLLVVLQHHTVESLGLGCDITGASKDCWKHHTCEAITLCSGKVYTRCMPTQFAAEAKKTAEGHCVSNLKDVAHWFTAQQTHAAATLAYEQEDLLDNQFEQELEADEDWNEYL